MELAKAVDAYIKKYPDGYLTNILSELKEEDLIEEEIVQEEMTRALHHKGAISERDVNNFNKLRAK